jgi:hypothetical protein
MEIQVLQGFEVGADFGVGPILRADELAADEAVAVDDVGLGPHFGVVELGGGLVGIADGDEVEVAAVDEALVLVCVLVNADGEHGQVRPVAVELKERRRFLDAGCAPGGPEVDQNDFAAIAGEMDGGASVREVEVGSRQVDLCGAGATVASGEEGQRKQHDESE